MKFSAGHVYQITGPKLRQDKRTVSRVVSQQAEGKMTASRPVPSSGGQWPPTYDRGELNAGLYLTEVTRKSGAGRA